MGILDKKPKTAQLLATQLRAVTPDPPPASQPR
jgi:hypothetical protein